MKSLKSYFLKLGVIALISAWLLAGWPAIWQNPRIPLEIKKAQAALSMSFIGSVEGSAANGGDVTLDLSGLGLQEGDLVIVAYAIGDNDNVNFDMAILSPTGYTEVADLFADDTQDTNLGVYWKIMGATPDTSVTVDGQGGTDAATAAVAMVFRGVDPVTPMDVTPTTATALNTMHPNPPAIDYVSTGVWTVIAGASGHALNLANTNNPYTFPTGYTTNNVQRPENDTSDITVGLGYRTNPADPEDPGVMTHSGTDSTNYSWAAVTLALRPKVVTFNQSAYRFFNNLDSTDVGTPLAAQDTAATLGSSGAAFRLRMLLHIGVADLFTNEGSFKLQFAQRGADNQCDTAFSGETYNDVTAATVIAYNDNPTPADGASLTANANDPTHGADTIVNQTYEELNDFANSVAAIPSGQDGKWDFSLKDNGATANTAYCLRAVKSDGTVLDTYSVIPQITTASAAATVSCSTNVSSTSFGTVNPSSVFTASPNASTTMSCSGTSAGCTLYVKDAGSGSQPGLWNSTSSILIPSPNAAFSATSTLVAGTAGYGIQATTTASGLTIAARYNQTGNTVGGLTLTDTVLASSTADISTSTVNIIHKMAVSAATLSGSYNDTITYSCVVN